MLPKRNRIVNEKDIKTIFRSRYTYFSPEFKVFMSKNNNQTFSLLVVVSKKISKKAHDRIRLKRKIHSLFEELSATHSLPPSVSCAIQVTSKNLLFKPKSTLKEEIIPKIGLLYTKI